MQNVHEVVSRDGKALRSPDLFHPGYILKEEIEAREITKKDFAELLNILPTHLSEIFAGRRPVGAKMALRLEIALDISAGFWLRMQSDYDLKVAEQDPDPVLIKIEDILEIQQQSNTSLGKAIVAYEVAQAGYASGFTLKARKSTSKAPTKKVAVTSNVAAESEKLMTVKSGRTKKTL